MCIEIKPVNPKGNQSWIFIGRTDIEAETPILCPLDAKSWLIWKDPDAGKDWRWEEKGKTEDEMVGWHHQLNGHVQFSSFQSCLTLRDPMDHSKPGLPVHHQLPESTQTHVHPVSDAIQPSHPLLSLSLPAFNLSQHQGLFRWVSSMHQVAKVLQFQLEHQSFQWISKNDLL